MLTSIEPRFLKKTTRIARPIAASAAATVKVSIANICPDMSFKKDEKAMNELQFSRKRIAQDVLKTLKSAVANAENNHNLDIDELYVNEAYVGKNLVLKRWKARARGRVGRIKKPFSQLTVVVKQSENEDSN